MRTTVRIGSAIAGVLYLALLSVASQFGSWGDGSGYSGRKADILMFYPLAYFAICFWASFAQHRKQAVVKLSVLANILLAALAIAACFMGSSGHVFLWPTAVCVVVWLRLYLSLPETANAPPENPRGPP